ncbi:hypothetical protein HMPREF3113_00150 [Stenotrophomonas sp. HMSC10F06]|nr:hypothetical protein BIZ42_08775 [Stenotrophomonas sp. LM091]OFS97604.1 hypothetical protein HMPREF3113_00150 [Stenotrophomonas sp. HMSC10F06]
MESTLGQVLAHLCGIDLGEATVGSQGHFENELERRQRGLYRVRDDREVITNGEIDEAVLLALAFIDVGLHAAGRCPG